MTWAMRTEAELAFDLCADRLDPPPVRNGPYCPACHNMECWQYVGNENGYYVFRHRDHPVTHDYQYRRFESLR